MSEELKPCPYCSDAMPTVNRVGRCYTVECGCGMTGPYADEPIEAIAAWNALPRRLRWTKEKPTEIGMYWYKESDNISMTVEVFRERVFFTNGTSADGELLYNMPGYDFDLSVSESTGEWAGPIPEPEESL